MEWQSWYFKFISTIHSVHRIDRISNVNLSLHSVGDILTTVFEHERLHERYSLHSSLLPNYERPILFIDKVFIERRELFVYCLDQPIRQRGKTTKYEPRAHSELFSVTTGKRCFALTKG